MPADAPRAQRTPTPTLDYATPPPKVAPLVPRYRKVLAAMLFVIGVLLAADALFMKGEAARANVAISGFAFICYGLVIRWGHVRLE